PLLQPVRAGEEYTVGGFRFSIRPAAGVPKRLGGDPSTEFVDADRLGGSLVLRSWREGDWFMPLGLGARKKLSDFFTEEKIPVYRKPAVPILESDGAIVWVCGRRLDDRFKITPRTTRVVRLQYSPLTRS
ncbi:MAG: tRNA lysidine(34) synthetase TilS, partial [Bacteroidota bacterium]